jgi:predicted dehydrogenase
MSRFLQTSLVILSTMVLAVASADEPAKPMRIGMIGLDTSHCLAFAEMLNKQTPAPEFAGFRLVLVYPKGSPDIESSVSRVPEYTTKIKALGVEICDDLDTMISQVDAVLLETNDGRPHLEQVLPVLKAHKPVFIDKPIAGSLVDAISIFELAKHYKTPVFSSSSLRFSQAVQEIRSGSIGRITGCDAYSPCSLEATHPDLFWYGIHGCETLFTVMGAGCESVVRTSTKDFDQVTGVWTDGRIGTFRGIRAGGSGYGGTAFGEKSVASLGKFDGYGPLLVEICKFFRTGETPVSTEETIDLYAFMEAADESKRQGFVPVKIVDVKAKAAEAAAKKVAELK